MLEFEFTRPRRFESESPGVQAFMTYKTTRIVRKGLHDPTATMMKLNAGDETSTKLF